MDLFRQGEKVKQDEILPTFHSWGETRELRIIPMHEIRNLRDDIAILNESEADN